MRDDLIESRQVKVLDEIYTIDIFTDDYAESPREWDNLGTCSFAHRKYDIGDNNAPKFESVEEFEEFAKEHDAVYLKVYMYEHSGITVSTKPFNDRWDSGLLGFIYATAQRIKQEYKIEETTEEIKQKVKEILGHEIEALDQWVSGDIYRYDIYDSNGNNIDSCSGFYGIETAIECAMEYIPTEEELLRQREEENYKREQSLMESIDNLTGIA